MTESERLDAKKAMAYDLQKLIEKERANGKESFTPEEINALMDAYIAGMQQ